MFCELRSTQTVDGAASAAHEPGIGFHPEAIFPLAGDRAWPMMFVGPGFFQRVKIERVPRIGVW